MSDKKWRRWSTSFHKKIYEKHAWKKTSNHIRPIWISKPLQLGLSMHLIAIMLILYYHHMLTDFFSCITWHSPLDWANLTTTITLKPHIISKATKFPLQLRIPKNLSCYFSMKSHYLFLSGCIILLILFL